ncbi:hypothetical protein Cni_G26133 [Canna indica]|uniref:PHD-type domain-containing protein n=1 Tax=Canna indica TaxID=4628 RepID=A0AAQ3L5I8_9LILI|nr:hypothetical protein Cni_G26133 [Canna indica]
MANGRGPSDLEDGALPSGIRTGFKREFAFAIKSQAQISLSPGRTRSGKSPSAIAVPSRESKRQNRSAGTLADPALSPLYSSQIVVCFLPSDPVAVDVQASLEVRDEAMDAVTVGKGSAVEATVMRDDRDETVVDDLPSPVNPIHALETSWSGGKTDGMVAQSESKGETTNTANSVSLLEEMAEPSFTSRNVVDDMNKMDVEMVADSPLEESVVIDSNDGLKVGISGKENQVNFTETPTNDASDEPTIMTPHPIMKMDDGGSSVKVCPDGMRFGDGVLKKTFVKRFTRSSLNLPVIEHKELSVDSPVKINCQQSKDSNSNLENPMRRLTRSASKAISESASGDIASTSSSSSGFDDTKGALNTADCSSILTPKKKMELKMSKKITSAKLPSNIRDLLSTGLLEGLPVNYISSSSNHIALQGMIKGNGILCSCSSCNSSAVVSAYVFEQHAGSTKKHPANFIYLPNGKSLHDVVKACSNAPLDMLEATIQNAISAVSAKKTFACQKCKGPIHTPRAGKFALLCDSCLGARPSKAPTILGNINTTRLLNTGSLECTPDSSSKNLLSNKKTSTGRLTRKDLGLHKLVFMNDILPEGTEIGYYVRGKRLLAGYIKDSGIYCQCCNSVVSPSQFEAHAGQASRRKPYNYIYTSNGVSLHELSVSLAKDRKASCSESDDLCSICADGGNLLLCDLCPRAFHKECVGLSTVPKGDWYCQYCQNLHQREKCLASNQNAIAAGRVAGVDPIEQIFKRCIRIVTTSETDESACTLCRCHDFSKSRFDDRTVMICDQCEREYHVGCLRDHKMADLKELPAGEWFCCTDCSRIRNALQEFLQHGAQSLSFSDIENIKKKCDINTEVSADIRWRLLSGRTLEADSKVLLSRAVAIFHESFDPIVEAITGRDLIPSMVYGRTVRDQDFGGMYCPVLIVGSFVVSAGILRVLGNEVAELPLVATSREHQGKGYFQSLFVCIERFLASLGVKHLVLPAAEEAESIWTNKFGFVKISSEQLEEYLKGAHPTVFQGTSMLHKPVSVVQCFWPDATQVLKDSLCLAGKNNTIVISLKYERLGTVCFYCCHIGHRRGPWLKAEKFGKRMESHQGFGCPIGFDTGTNRMKKPTLVSLLRDFSQLSVQACCVGSSHVAPAYVQANPSMPSKFISRSDTAKAVESEQVNPIVNTAVKLRPANVDAVGTERADPTLSTGVQLCSATINVVEADRVIGASTKCCFFGNER